MSKHLVRILATGAAAIILLIAATLFYSRYLSPSKVLVVNPLPAQAADITLNNNHSGIEVTCMDMSSANDFDRYDAVLIFGRGLYLDTIQMKSIEKAAAKGIPVFAGVSRAAERGLNCNLDSLQIERLANYFNNPCRHNYCNLLRYVRSFATPYKWGDISYEEPLELPNNMYYYKEAGVYFERASQLTEYLKERGIYNENGRNVVFVSGLKFPVESNRAHIDTLISRLTAEGYNVYPLSGYGRNRERMILEAKPSAVIFLPMGRLGRDSLIENLYSNEVPLFMPFPLVQSTEDWLDILKPLSAGSLNARIVAPEFDGAMTPLCISTQNKDSRGFMIYTPEKERIDAFMEQFHRFMILKSKPNNQKRVAICYFGAPGSGALVASGMEVVPSIYNLLRRLKQENYNVDGLPATVEGFKRLFNDGPGVKWIDKKTYEKWASEVLLPQKYDEIVSRYGEAPGTINAKGDSVAVYAMQFGNVLLFPQQRPAIGSDEYKLVHGVDVAPPHNYVASYLYMQRGFDADVLFHFGTHGNLEFTPGKNAGLSQADWAEVLVGNRPHLYIYTTGNIGEAVIAKRRSHAVIISYLTPPFVESGLRSKLSGIMGRVHSAIANPSNNSMALKREIMKMGLHRDLSLDSLGKNPYTTEELQRVDAYLEELVNEKITGAFYNMGLPYSTRDLNTTVLAVLSDKLAYARAKRDCDAGRITKEQLHNYNTVSRLYLQATRRDIGAFLEGRTPMTKEMEEVAECRDLLIKSPTNELDAIVGVLAGKPVRPAPGGDPVLNPNVLPTGRNMYSINAEATPGERAWKDGALLADKTVEDYLKRHGEYPRKISYTFWAGEFISSEGATLAQAFRMLGVEPVRDNQGRVMDLKLTPSEELGRPRVNIMVQVSGQLRDIAASRLRMLTEAVELASESTGDLYPNYVAEGSVEQEREMVERGATPKRARELSTMRVFGPANSGYSTGMISYTENSGDWDSRNEIASGYLNNMCAMYGDTTNWGNMDRNLLETALKNTDVIVQPRQSNTWGAVSLDHVYEFTGSISLAATKLSGREPEALLADYRNVNMPKIQNAKEAVALEARATILNPVYISERMKGDASTAQMFGKIFRNIFGWNVMRQSILADNLYDELYETYVQDRHSLGIKAYFSKTNPVAFVEMTATMLESVRKGYWEASEEQIARLSSEHAEMLAKSGNSNSAFVRNNRKLQNFIASKLPAEVADKYLQRADSKLTPQGKNSVVLSSETLMSENLKRSRWSEISLWSLAGIALAAFAVVVAAFVRGKRRE